MAVRDDYRAAEISARSGAAFAAPWSKGLNPDLLFCPTAPRLPMRTSFEDCKYSDRTFGTVARREDMEFIVGARNFIGAALEALAAGKPMPSGEYSHMRELLGRATPGQWLVSYADPFHGRGRIQARQRVATGEDGGQTTYESRFSLVAELFRRDGETIQPEAELIAGLKADVEFLLGALAPMQTATVDGFTLDHEDAEDARRYGPWAPCPVENGRAWNETTGAFLDALLMPHDPLGAWVEYRNGRVTDLRRANLAINDALVPVVLRLPPRVRADLQDAVKAGGFKNAEELVTMRCL